MAGKIQKQDVKTEAELIAAGASASSLINDTQIYVTASGINKTLDDAIVDGDIGGGGGGGGLQASNFKLQTYSNNFISPIYGNPYRYRFGDTFIRDMSGNSNDLTLTQPQNAVLWDDQTGWDSVNFRYVFANAGKYLINLRADFSVLTDFNDFSTNPLFVYGAFRFPFNLSFAADVSLPSFSQQFRKDGGTNESRFGERIPYIYRSNTTSWQSGQTFPNSLQWDSSFVVNANVASFLSFEFLFQFNFDFGNNAPQVSFPLLEWEITKVG
jgi:hypothetical protein